MSFWFFCVALVLGVLRSSVVFLVNCVLSEHPVIIGSRASRLECFDVFFDDFGTVTISREILISNPPSPMVV